MTIFLVYHKEKIVLKNPASHLSGPRKLWWWERKCSRIWALMNLPGDAVAGSDHVVLVDERTPTATWPDLDVGLRGHGRSGGRGRGGREVQRKIYWGKWGCVMCSEACFVHTYRRYIVFNPSAAAGRQDGVICISVLFSEVRAMKRSARGMSGWSDSFSFVYQVVLVQFCDTFFKDISKKMKSNPNGMI